MRYKMFNIGQKVFYNIKDKRNWCKNTTVVVGKIHTYRLTTNKNIEYFVAGALPEYDSWINENDIWEWSQELEEAYSKKSWVTHETHVEGKPMTKFKTGDIAFFRNKNTVVRGFITEVRLIKGTFEYLVCFEASFGIPTMEWKDECDLRKNVSELYEEIYNNKHTGYSTILFKLLNNPIFYKNPEKPMATTYQIGQRVRISRKIDSLHCTSDIATICSARNMGGNYWVEYSNGRGETLHESRIVGLVKETYHAGQSVKFLFITGNYGENPIEKIGVIRSYQDGYYVIDYSANGYLLTDSFHECSILGPVSEEAKYSVGDRVEFLYKSYLLFTSWGERRVFGTVVGMGEEREDEKIMPFLKVKMDILHEEHHVIVKPSQIIRKLPKEEVRYCVGDFVEFSYPKYDKEEVYCGKISARQWSSDGKVTFKIPTKLGEGTYFAVPEGKIIRKLPDFSVGDWVMHESGRISKIREIYRGKVGDPTVIETEDNYVSQSKNYKKLQSEVFGG